MNPEVLGRFDMLGVLRVRVSPQGLVLAAGDEGLIACDGDLEAVEAKLQEPTHFFGGALATSHYDEWAVASDSRRIHLFDLRRRLRAGERDLGSPIFDLAWSPQSDCALVAAAEGLAVVDLVEGEGPWIDWLARDRAYVAVAFAPDGRLGAAGQGAVIELWGDLDQPESSRLARLEGHQEEVCSLAIAPKGELLVSGGADGTVRLWDLPGGRARGAPLTGHDGPVLEVALNPHVQRIFTAGADGTLRLWDVPTRREILCLDAHEGGARSVAWFPDGSRAVSAGGDELCAWRLPGAWAAAAMGAGYRRS